MNWLKKLFGKSKAEHSSAEDLANDFNSWMYAIKEAGSVNGEHYTDSVETIKQLKREGKNKEAISILLRSVEATETESRFAGHGWGVAPWYYEQLAILYRKEKHYQQEVAILERYANQPKAPGVGSEKLAARLGKAKELLAKHGV